MLITSAELVEVAIPLLEPFRISGGDIRERRSLIVRLHDDEGNVGLGEAPPFDRPFYSSETLGSARLLIEGLLLPRVAGQRFGSPQDVDAVLREGVRGNPFARAAVETAAWDLAAARARTGMAALLARAAGVPQRASIPCGVALGIPEGRSLDVLRARILAALDEGYRRVKIKIMPGWDVEPVRAAAEVLRGTGIPLTVDANGAYAWPDDRAVLAQLDPFGLLYIEQPLAPDELVGHATLARVLDTPVCLDETLTHAGIARQVLELDGPRTWNIKVHRVGGLSEVLRIVAIAATGDVRLWAGTMPETGIGSQAPLAAAALAPFTLPSDLEPSARWYGRNRDVIKLAMGRDGTMPVPGVSISRLLDARRLADATASGAP